MSGQRRQASPVKESRLRQEALLHHSNNDAARHRTPDSSSRHFGRAPRFAFGRRASQTAQPSRPHQPQSQRLKDALRSRLADDVEEQNNDAEDGDDDMLDVEHDQALPTIENSGDLRDLPFSPKRRKYSNGDVGSRALVQVMSPARPSFKQPITPAPHVTAAQFAQTRSASGSRAEGIQLRRPAFLPSSLAPSARPEPLPEAFSPHRRGEKFVPGGMAATLQQWIIETGQNAAQSRRGQGYLRGEDYVVRCTVASVRGRAPCMVRGIQSDGTEVNLLLVADSKQITVAVGNDLGVRAPVWDVQLEDCSWTVGVDWKVVE